LPFYNRFVGDSGEKEKDKDKDKNKT